MLRFLQLAWHLCSAIDFLFSSCAEKASIQRVVFWVAFLFWGLFWVASKKSVKVIKHQGHNTVAEYIDTLSDSFVLHYLFCYDTIRNKPAYQKEKKVYFTDPFFLHAMRAWIGGKKPFESTMEYLGDPEKVGALVEGVVADHMVRLSFRLCEQKQLFLL